MPRQCVGVERSGAVANANDKSAPVQMLDSLSAYEFQVEIDGQVISGVFGVHGLTSYRRKASAALLITKIVQREPNTPRTAGFKNAAGHPEPDPRRDDRRHG